MKNEKTLKEWMEFARMDFLAAKHLYEHMYPKPLEIICYHCQQAIEKLLKGVLISRGVTIEKTHDLGLLAEMLQEYTEVDEKYLEICDDLTPYGVKIRYPQELYDWLLTLLQAEKMNLDAIEEQEDSGEGNYS
ncbi:MAG TPA: HEPN domain-containing protein [Candidatus Mediterraneibacter intestinipullorum]|nr:HEPN domain-containing protein [Candidatus Mediterraneibacter intestinipullorum]